MTLHFPHPGYQKGYTTLASPETSPLQKITFGRLQLNSGSAPYTASTEGNEVVVTILSGKADVEASVGGDRVAWTDLGGRDDVFAGDGTYVCLPPSCQYTVTARSDALDIAVSSGPCPEGGSPSVILPGESETRRAGALNWQRIVRLGTANSGKSRRLMVGETLSRPGGWSSFPPHKHDVARPGEIPMEEVYFFQIKPRQGFAIQVLYDAPGRQEGYDDAFLVHDGDTVVLDHGYHPVAAAPGYQVYYLWVLYSEEGIYGSAAWSDDPDHVWLHNVPPMLA